MTWCPNLRVAFSFAEVAVTDDRALRRLIEYARSDPAFGRLLAVSPVQAVQQAPFLNAAEKSNLRQTATHWVTHIDQAKQALRMSGKRGDKVVAHADTLHLLNTVGFTAVSHLVRPGETLESIAALYTGDPGGWMQLRDINALGAAPQIGARLVLPSQWATPLGNGFIAITDLLAHDNGSPAVLPAAPRKLKVQPGDNRPKFPPFSPINLNGLLTSLSNQVNFDSGYGFCLMARQGGVVYPPISNGFARGPTAPVNPNLHWSQNVRSEVASISKFVTMLALINLLNEQGLTPDEYILPWLPKYWQPGLNADRIQFRDLLRHQTNFGCYLDFARYYGYSGSPFEDCKTATCTVQDLATIGSTSNNLAPACYDNSNFVLLRVLISQLSGITVPWDDPSFSNLGDAVWDAGTAKAYKDYVNGTIFPMANVAPSQFTSTSADALIYYAAGWESFTDLGDQTSNSGASGWHLSVNEVLNLANTFRNGAFGPADTWLGDYFGVDPFAWSLSSSCGDVKNSIYNKNGGIPGATTYNLEQWIQTNLWFLPDDTEIVLFINSWTYDYNGNYVDPRAMLTSALNNPMGCPSSPTPCNCVLPPPSLGGGGGGGGSGGNVPTGPTKPGPRGGGGLFQ